ncbi:MAG: DUF1844 domain-containing protein [bacterium]
MAGKDRKDEDFKIEDRRTSTTSTEESTEEGPGEGSDASAEEEKEAAESSLETGESTPETENEELRQSPPVDFSTFLFSLFSSVLIQLGEMVDPITGEQDKNLVAAKQTIDLFAILQEKTSGNLTNEEDNFLKNASAELKWKYLDAIKEKG